MNNNNSLAMKRLGLFVIFCAILALLQFFNWYAGFDLAYWHARAHELKVYADQWHWMSVGAYMGIFISATVFAIPVTVFLTVVGGIVFGFFEAIIYAVSAATIGSGILFLLVRHGIGFWIQDQYRDQLAPINENIAKYGAYYVLMLQLLPFTPTPLITLSAGLSTMSLSTFMLATAVGILPGTVVYVVLAEQAAGYISL